MPLVLRGTDQTHDGGKCHTLVGDAYVDGIMDGMDFEKNATSIYLLQEGKLDARPGVISTKHIYSHDRPGSQRFGFRCEGWER